LFLLIPLFLTLLWLFRFLIWNPFKEIKGVKGWPLIGVSLYLGRNPFEFLQTCKKQFGGIFWLNIAGRAMLVDGDREITKVLMKAPEEVASSGTGVIKAFGLELFVNMESIQNYIHIDILKVSFSATLPLFYSPLLHLGKSHVSQLLSQDKNIFEDLMVELSYPLVCKLTTRSVLGPEFDDNTPLHQIFIDYNRIAEYLMGVGLLVPKIFHGFFTGPAKQQDELVKNYVMPVIKERRNRRGDVKEDQIDLLQKLIDEGLNDEAILTSIKTIMWASMMNTSSLLMHLLYDIFSRPNIKQKVEEEQRGIPEMTYESLDKMIYLEACAKESLRMSSAPFGAVRETFEDVSYSKKGTIPKNSLVLISRHLVHYDENYWKNPSIYLPDRFLQKIKNWAFIPFGGGIHSCPGRFYALFVVKLVISILVKEYDITVPGGRPKHIVLGNEVRSAKAPIIFTKKTKVI